MRKIIKHISLLSIIFTGSIFSSPFFYDISYDIRKDLQAKHAQGLLVECMLIESDLSLEQVLDRDIRIMQDYNDCLKLRVKFHKGFWIRTILPSLKAFATSFTGTLSAGTGLLAIGGTSWVNEKWEGKDNPAIKASDVCMNIGSWMGLIDDSQIAEYNQNKLQEICKKYPQFMGITVLVPVAGAISVVSGLLFIKMAISWYRHDGKMNMAIAKLQKRINRNNAIIYQLKQLKSEHISN